ncbi:sugar ABC transporter permease [bacterium]|nr:sugar ABC transporter permease [bacterium]
MRKKKSRLVQQEIKAFYLFLSPWIIGMVLFTGGPLIASFLFSFTSYDIVKPPVWCGLSNYKEIFSDKIFIQSLKVTLKYVMGAVPLNVIGALILATILNQKVYGLSIWRTIYYLPVVTTGVAVSLLWSWVLNPEFGIVNTLLQKIFGIRGPDWFYSERWAIPSFILMSIWGVGGPMLIYLGGMQGIPTQLYEAAEIDGASWWQSYIHITLPLITPVIFYNLVTSIIGTFQVFTPAFIITQGGPNYASYFYVLNLFKHAFQYYHMGYASALAWILFVVVLILTIIAFRIANYWVYYEEKR